VRIEMMNKILWNTLKQSPGVLGAALLITNAAIATEAPSALLASTPESASVTIRPSEDLNPSGQNQQFDQLSLADANQIAFSQMPVDALETVASQSSEAPASMAAPTQETANATLETSEVAPVQVAQVETVAPEQTSVSDLEQITEYSDQTDAMDQVTSVSQLSDVQPTDWAFQALQSLVERYGCIAGYPDGTYKGNRAMTRYEFAAGLNACLERVNELIAASVANLVTREDLAVLQRLQEEFAAELATLRGRVYALEARTAELEANQFSTTTKLRGEVVFWPGDSFGERATNNVVGQFATDEDDDPTQTYLGYRVRLNFDTSFTGQDLLRTRLEARDIPNLSNFDLTNTLMTRTSIDGETDGVALGDLYYRFPIASGKGQVYIGANDMDLDDVLTPLNPLESSSTGAISRFGRYNPATFRGPEGAGAALKFDFSKSFQLNLAYLAQDGTSANADEGEGLFNGSNSAAIQFVFKPTDNIGLGLEYNRRYFSNGEVDVTGGTGSWIANRPFGENATTTDNVGFQSNWRITDGVELGGWFGATWAQQQNGGDDDATVLNWAVTLAFPDLFREGSLGGLIVGMPPKVTSHPINDLEDNDTSIHIEAFYRYQINDYISITPGFFVLTNPDHNDANDTEVVGTLRTTFRF
jgi:hypothetical protein